MRILAFLLFLGLGFTAAAQELTLDELKAVKAEKQTEMDGIKGEIDDLQKLIDEFPGWKIGAFGTIGFSLSNFSNWYARDAPNTSAGNIGITVNAYANLDREKFFWRNATTLNLGWVKYDDEDDPDDNPDFEQATDVFNISSLYGYKLSEKFAISALGEYRTTILNNFNDPGYLDLGVGATWTPISDLVVVIHPLNYNFVFADDETIYMSSLGCKILADYTKKFDNGISYKSNLSAFLSYEDLENLSNWTWTNGVSFEIWKGIGFGGELGLRNNKQEAVDYQRNTLGNPDIDFDNVDNELQVYWLLGLTYSF